MKMNDSETKIKAIRSGGQTGVDRGALDAAIEMRVPVEGWCPKGGWAEDYPDAPGLLTKYPHFKETPSSEPSQRTVWNVRDSDATLILDFEHDLSDSPGTVLTASVAESLNKPFLVAKLGECDKIISWINGIHGEISLNIAGPRESEAPGIYAETYSVVKELLSNN
ncbi:MAG: putative molybdenum carrier protein [Clostridiales bacterium]|jgi:hypothetical protein|nr:putative molybdenum carrier protein [Clostridiales bacterium]